MSSFTFAPIFGDGMVLQRDHELTIWGTSDEEGTVRVYLGNSCSESAVVDGTWKCVIPPQKAAVGLTLLAKQGAEIIRVQNVMIGDVWLAGGQSNMEFFLRYETHWQEAQALPKNKMIRMYTCPRVAFAGQKPYQSGCGYWFGEGDSAWETFSSAAYWFARELQPELDIPVGIIACNWGGTSASAWVPAKSLEGSDLGVYLQDYEAAVAGIDLDENRQTSMLGWAFQEDPDHIKEWAGVMYGIDREAQLERIVRCTNNPVVPMGPYNKNRPGCLYEQMVTPIRNYSVKGILWYQGENDVHHAPLYSTLFATLISEWRKIWDTDIPFIFSQLAPFDRWLALDGEMFPEIRRQQEIVSRTVPHCWMISTADVGMRYDIHPKEKKTLGHRFFLQAMDKVYGNACLADAPEVKRIAITDNRIHLQFSDSGNELYLDGEVEHWVSITQDGQPISVEHVDVIADTVILTTSDNLKGSVRIMFAQTPYYKVTLYNQAQIPVKPFSRTVEA